jgi:hypothetical protein
MCVCVCVVGTFLYFNHLFQIMFVYRTYSMEDCSAMHGCSALLQFEPGMFYDKDYFKRLHEFPSLRFLY